MTVVLTPTDEYNVSARDGLWMSAADAEKVTGWTLKPEGMCRDERCVPLPAAAVKGKEVDVEAFWQRLGGPVIASEEGDVWALGAPADERNAALEGSRGARLHPARHRRRAAHAVAAPRQEGLPRHLGQLVRLPLRLARVAGPLR